MGSFGPDALDKLSGAELQQVLCAALEKATPETNAIDLVTHSGLSPRKFIQALHVLNGSGVRQRFESDLVHNLKLGHGFLIPEDLGPLLNMQMHLQEEHPGVLTMLDQKVAEYHAAHGIPSYSELGALASHTHPIDNVGGEISHDLTQGAAFQAAEKVAPVELVAHPIPHFSEHVAPEGFAPKAKILNPTSFTALAADHATPVTPAHLSLQVPAEAHPLPIQAGSYTVEAIKTAGTHALNNGVTTTIPAIADPKATVRRLLEKVDTTHTPTVPAELAHDISLDKAIGRMSATVARLIAAQKERLGLTSSRPTRPSALDGASAFPLLSAQVFDSAEGQATAVAETQPHSANTDFLDTAGFTAPGEHAAPIYTHDAEAPTIHQSIPPETTSARGDAAIREMQPKWRAAKKIQRHVPDELPVASASEAAVPEIAERTVAHDTAAAADHAKGFIQRIIALGKTYPKASIAAAAVTTAGIGYAALHEKHQSAAVVDGQIR